MRTLRIILTAFFSLVVLSMTAQHKLIRVNSEPEEGQTASPLLSFFDKEMKHLLMPQGAAFGVECIPSFSPEWTLSYDSVAHTLVYQSAEKSVWHNIYRAMNELEKIDGKNTWVPRKEPKDYTAPDVKTYSMPVSADQMQMLRAIWTTAVGMAEDREVFILDGTKWEYFVDGKRAKSHSEKNVLVKFTNELAKAVGMGDASRKDSLIGNEFQNVVAGLTIAPQPEVLEPGTVRKLIIANGKPLTDANGFVGDLGQDELVYFNHRQQNIRRVAFYREEQDKQRFGEQCGVKVKDMVTEYITEPDKHCDAYVDEHPEMKQTHRRVEGYLLDNDGKPWADTWVYVEGDSRMGSGTATDSAGHFVFWVPRKGKTLAANCGINWVGNIKITDSPLTIRMARLH